MLLITDERLINLCSLVEQQKKERLKRLKMDCQVNIDNCKINLVDGKKYIKLDVGRSGFVMIDKLTEDIFGIKAYGVIHKGHHYGDLSSISSWYWGEYYPSKNN
jgi:hypothetical protein